MRYDLVQFVTKTAAFAFFNDEVSTKDPEKKSSQNHYKRQRHKSQTSDICIVQSKGSVV